jgi:hypothetical protein
MRATIKYHGHVYKLAASSKFKGGDLRRRYGFSDDVFNSRTFQDYIKERAPGGYLGSGTRNAAYDQELEKLLRQTGLRAEGIATWLTSSTARHMMDNVTRTMGRSWDDVEGRIKAFVKVAKEYTKNAARDVAAWSHPDHSGNLASHGKVVEHLQDIFGGEKK